VGHDFLRLIPILEHRLRHAEEPWGGLLDQLDQCLLIARDQAFPKRQLPLRGGPPLQSERRSRLPAKTSRSALRTYVRVQGIMRRWSVTEIDRN
jgi:hypothetical protein